MFRCEVTGRISQPGSKCHKIVIQTRPRVYFSKIKNEETLKWETVEVARGTEIVKEISATEEGVALWSSFDQAMKDKILSTPLLQRVHLHV